MGGITFSSLASDRQGGVWIGGQVLEEGLLVHATPAVKPHTAPDFHRIEDVFFTTAMSGWMIADWGTVYSSTDRIHWTRVDVGERDFKRIYFYNERLGWLVGKAGAIYRTTDAGKTWVKQKSETNYEIEQVQFANPLEGWAVGHREYTDSSVLLSTRDGGDHWYTIPEEKPVQIRAFSFVSEYEGWAVNYGDDILHTTDRGLHWQVQRSGTRYGMTSIQFVNASEGWAAGDGLLHTSDGGATWQYQVEPGKANFENHFDMIYFSDPQHGWALDFFAVLFTTDGGITWKPLDQEWKTSTVTRALKEMGQRPEVIADGKPPLATPVTIDTNVTEQTRQRSSRGSIVKGAERNPTGSATKLADDQAQPVSYCELVNNKSRFYGKLVRVTATLLTQLDSVSLYDSACPNEGVEPVLDCDDDEECSRLQKMLHENSDFDGDVSRVEAVLVGRLQQPTNLKENSRSEFVFKTIEETRKIPSKVNSEIRNGRPPGTFAQEPLKSYTVIPSFLMADQVDVSKVPAPFRFKAYCAPNERQFWTVGGQGEVLFLSTNQAPRHFNLKSNHLFNGDLNGIYFNGKGVGWVVGDRGIIFHSDDYGNTWIEQSVGGEDGLSAVTCADSKTCWIVGDNGLILRTTDGGTTWAKSVHPSREPLNAVDFIDSKNGWIAGNNGLVLSSKDGGESWERYQVPLSCEPVCDKWGVPLNAIRFISEKVGWVASTDQIGRTEDGGKTWRVVPITYTEENQVVCIVGLVAHDEKTIWAISECQPNYFSKDGGLTWLKMLEQKDPRGSVAGSSKRPPR